MGATQFKIADVEKSLTLLLAADAGIVAFGAQVQALSSKDFDEQGNIIVMPPAVLVFFEGGQDSANGDMVRTAYKSEYSFCIFCGAADLSSTDNERNSAYALIAAVRKAVAGARLPLDLAQNKTGPVGLAGINPEQFDANGAWYSQKISVPMTAQFS
jgi:hypothetical protein